jgi:predicted Ser/Thr protein kinase
MSHVIEFGDTYIIKTFGSGLDKLNLQREIMFYKLLEGHNLTPPLLDHGDNYIKIEKYQDSLDRAVANNIIPSHIYRIVYNKIIHLVKQLDSLHIIHNDLFPRNIVYNGFFEDVRIIDFEKAFTCENNSTNLTCNFFENFNIIF